MFVGEKKDNKVNLLFIWPIGPFVHQNENEPYFKWLCSLFTYIILCGFRSVHFPLRIVAIHIHEFVYNRSDFQVINLKLIEVPLENVMR